MVKKHPVEAARHLKVASAPVYEPATDIVSPAEIDLDLVLIDELMNAGNFDDAIAAIKVYEEGSFSWPYAELTIKEGIPLEVFKGTKVTGINEFDNPVVGTILEHAKAGSKHIKVQYVTSDVHNADQQCPAGANPHRSHQGCFAAKGAIEIEGHDGKMHYEYNEVADNKAYRSLQGFSKNAEKRMKPCSACHYFHDYQQFLDYYDEPTYADKWISAAFGAESVSFQRGGANFTGLDASARADIVEAAAAYMSTFMFTIRDLEDSVMQCQEDCDDHKCTEQALRLMDSSVAFYTGSLVETKGTSEGKMIYSLADQMCKDFKTCDISGDNLKGTSQVNHKVFGYFNEMQQDILADYCPGAHHLKSEVVHQMFVPLIQATLKSAYDRDSMQTGVTHEQEALGATYAASVLPMVHKCSVADAQMIFENMKTGADGTSFSQVKDAFERNYHCLGISCEDVGGYYRASKGEYHFGAEPCVTDVDGVDLNLKKHLPIAGITIFLMGVSFFLYSRYRLEQRRKRLARYDEENDLSESSHEDLIYA